MCGNPWQGHGYALEGEAGAYGEIFKGKNHYQYPYCGYILPKQDATISGYDSKSSLRHVHCPTCGKSVTDTP